MPWSSSPTTTTPSKMGWSVTPTTTRPSPTGWFARPRVQIAATPMTATAQLRAPTAAAGNTVTTPAMTAAAAHRTPGFGALTTVTAVQMTASATRPPPIFEVSAGIEADPMRTLTAGIAEPAVNAFNGDAAVTIVPMVAFPAMRVVDLSAEQAVTITAMTATTALVAPVATSGDNTGFPYRFAFPLGVGAATGRHVSARRMFAAAAVQAPAVSGPTAFPYTFPFTLS